MRAYRVRSGKQRSIPIPVDILAAVLAVDAVAEHLGAELVAAIREAVKS